jgi:hypothetical protein
LCCKIPETNRTTIVAQAWNSASALNLDGQEHRATAEHVDRQFSGTDRRKKSKFQGLNIGGVELADRVTNEATDRVEEAVLRVERRNAALVVKAVQPVAGRANRPNSGSCSHATADGRLWAL